MLERNRYYSTVSWLIISARLWMRKKCHFDNFRSSSQIKMIVMQHKPTKCTLFKLILSFNFWHRLHFPNLLGSSSGRLLYAQNLCGMFYKHWCKDEPVRFKTCGICQKLNRSINLKSMHFIVLCFPIHGAKKKRLCYFHLIITFDFASCICAVRNWKCLSVFVKVTAL